MNRLKQYFATRRATGNVVRMISGNMTRDEVDKIRSWRRESPEYQNSFVTTHQVMAGLQGLADDPEILALAEPPKKNNRKHRNPESATSLMAVKAPSGWPKIATAAVLLVGVIAVFFTQKQSPESPDNILRYVTRTGEQKTVNLTDGSVITLNTATQLLVDITPQNRRVIMERGEAWFDVAQDATRPFTVELGNRSISVLGTSFNLMRSPEKFTLAVLEGTVAVHSQGEIVSASAPEISVPPGESVRFKASKQKRVSAGTVVEFDNETQELLAYQPTDIRRIQSWRNGVLIFNDDPLYKVVQGLNRYSAKKILIEDKSIMDLQIFTTVRVDKIEGALAGFESMLPIKVTSYVDRIVIVGKKK